jgi:hypothetical protein
VDVYLVRYVDDPTTSIVKVAAPNVSGHWVALAVQRGLPANGE